MCLSRYCSLHSSTGATVYHTGSARYLPKQELDHEVKLIIYLSRGARHHTTPNTMGRENSLGCSLRYCIGKATRTAKARVEGYGESKRAKTAAERAYLLHLLLSRTAVSTCLLSLLSSPTAHTCCWCVRNVIDKQKRRKNVGPFKCKGQRQSQQPRTEARDKKKPFKDKKPKAEDTSQSLLIEPKPTSQKNKEPEADSKATLKKKLHKHLSP